MILQDPVAAVKQIARFLGQEVSDSLCADIAEACSFNKLKKADETKDTPVRHLFKGDNPQLYRKGAGLFSGRSVVRRRAWPGGGVRG